MSKRCHRCHGENFLTDGRCSSCNTATALNYYYANRESIAAKRKARREMINEMLAAHSSRS